MTDSIMITGPELREIIRNEIPKYPSMKALAKAIGVAPSYLSGILNHDRPISDRVAKYFGRKLVKMYEEE